MKRWYATATMAAMIVLAAAWTSRAADGQPAAVEKPTVKNTAPVVVLDMNSVWRTFNVLRPPVIQFDDGPKPVLTPHDWLNRETAPAPARWNSLEFDDGTWQRGAAGAFARTPYLSRLYQRARFEVTDPAAVGELKLKVNYYGGLTVYVNGKELARRHVGPATAGPEALAEGYPPVAFVGDDGKILPQAPWMVDRMEKVVAARVRKMDDVVIPPNLLRKGVNVLALELVRAPYHKIVDEKKADMTKKDNAANGSPYDLSWNTCELREMQLVAAGADGLVLNAARPKELQVWTSDFMTAETSGDQGDRCEPLRPLTIMGVRNGWFSGKAVVSSPQAITGLKAVCSDLKQDGATIPASALRIRYAASWGAGSIGGHGHAARPNASLLDALLESPLEVFSGDSGGTVVPIWVTVKVPAEAKPGSYQGELTITAQGEAPRRVPVRLEVADWKVPDAVDYRTWVELLPSPDTLVAEYGVPMWSDRHFEMMDQTLRYIGEIGSRVVYIPLICHTNSGNAESMVRWIRKDNGQMEYDFTIMDRYLDLAVRHMVKPEFVVLTAWEVYLNTPKEEVKIGEKDNDYIRMEKSWEAARWNLRGKGPAVTSLDPATGKTETVYLPRFEEPAAKALWQPLFDQLRQRLEKRGLAGAMRLGMASDSWPTKEELTVLHEVSGGLGWVRHTHGGNSVGQKMYGLATIDYTAYVWNVDYAPDPREGRTYGWKQPGLLTQFRRFTALNHMSPAALMHFEEVNITGQQRGLGRIGADNWRTIKNKKGERTGWVWDRYPQSLWHSLNLMSHMLVPGPTGPVASIRYEYLREGIQECEARIAIERVLTDEALKAKLSPELAARCQEVLDNRLREVWRSGSDMGLTVRNYASGKLNGDDYGGIAGHFWFAASGWQERTQQFYALAGEVARQVEAK